MKINDELHVLELPLIFGGVERIMSLSVIKDEAHGLTLVDTGLPGQIDLIAAALEADGLSLDDVLQIVVTHHDLDHIGSLRDLRDRTGAPIYAHKAEVPYIEGALRPIKMPPPDRLAEMPEAAARWRRFQPTPVDFPLGDNVSLERSGGATVIPTPGHTPGHISLYLPRTRTVIAGDALTSEAGVLKGPNENATPDLPLALQSLQNIAALAPETIVCYHGGPVTQNTANQLNRLIAS